MANRRMFSKKITATDLFIDMPMSAQCLYFHLNMEADDDGFLGNAKTIRRQIGASEDDLKILMAKEFIIPFESGVVVIKDWKIHNYIRKDTYNKTIYEDEKALLAQNTTGSYTFRGRSVDEPSTQDRLGKDRLGKDRLGKDRLGKDRLGKDSIGKSSRVEGIKKIYHYYESNGFGTLAQKTMQDFDYWIKDLMKIGATEEDAVEIIIHSLGIAVDRNKRNYGYANAILKDWEQKGFTKVSDILANDKKNNVDEPKMPDYSLPDEFKNQFDDIKEPDFEMPY